MKVPFRGQFSQPHGPPILQQSFILIVTTSISLPITSYLASLSHRSKALRHHHPHHHHQNNLRLHDYLKALQASPCPCPMAQIHFTGVRETKNRCTNIEKNRNQIWYVINCVENKYFMHTRTSTWFTFTYTDRYLERETERKIDGMDG